MSNASFSQVLGGTPWWVWFIFIYVLIIGVKALRPRIVSIYRLTLMPLLFVFLSIHTLFIVPLDFIRVTYFLLTSLIGVGIGFWQISRLYLQIDKKQKYIAVPGSITTLLLVLVIFASKYYFGYTIDTNPLMMQNNAFVWSMLAISGICTGMFIGRAICYFCRFKSLTHQELKTS